MGAPKTVPRSLLENSASKNMPIKVVNVKKHKSDTNFKIKDLTMLVYGFINRLLC